MQKHLKTFRRSSIDSKIYMRYRTNPGMSFAQYSYRRNHWSNRGEALIGAGSSPRSTPTYSTNSNNLPHTLAITPKFLHMHRKEVTTTSTKTKIYANLIKNYRRTIKNSSHSAYAWRKCANSISPSRLLLPKIPHLPSSFQDYSHKIANSSTRFNCCSSTASNSSAKSNICSNK